MGRCTDFGVMITSGCDHVMRAGASSCVCPGCGAECTGRYSGCPEVWAAAEAKVRPQPVAGPRAKRSDDHGHPPRDKWFEIVEVDPAVAVRPLAAPAAAAALSPAPPKPGPKPAASEPAVDRAVAGLERRAAEIDARAATVTRSLEAERAKLERLATKLAARAEEIDERAAAHSRAFDNDRAWLERLAAELPTRARQLDDRAEAHLRTLDGERASLDALAQELAVRAATRHDAVDHDRSGLPDELRRLVLGSLPALVADAIRLEGGRRAERQASPGAEASHVRAEPDPILAARQRSFEKQVDALTRRTQEIDERVTTHLRGLDQDRGVLADLIVQQDRLAQAIADLDFDGRHHQLVQWLADAVPASVAAEVDAAMKVKAAALSTAVGRVEKVRTDTKALADAMRESSERVLDTLFRRDQDSASQLQALAEERAAMTEMLEGGRAEIAQSVVNSLPALVEVAVRTAMERYATERRSGVLELAGRLRADADVMRDALQRSFEKMMEALANREQLLDDRAAAHVRELEGRHDTVAELWTKAARTVTDALPSMVAAAVTDSDQLDRTELEAVRQETARIREDQEAAFAALRAEHEATIAELRAAVAELQEALVERDGVVERQAAAYERALDGLRTAMARQPVKAAAGRTRVPEPPEPDPTPEALVAEVVDATNGGRVKLGRSSVPRAQRVERRMLKIDDRDDATWPGLSRRNEALSDLLAATED